MRSYSAKYLSTSVTNDKEDINNTVCGSYGERGRCVSDIYGIIRSISDRVCFSSLTDSVISWTALMNRVSKVAWAFS